MKKCVYAVCALLWAGCTASRSASDGSKDREQRRLCKSTASLPILSSGISIRPTLQPTSGPTDVCMSMPPMTSIRRAVATLMDQYHVFSTDDMVHWTDHGEILRASQVPWGRKEGGFMWAPDCAYKGRHVLFLFSPSQRNVHQ